MGGAERLQNRLGYEPRLSQLAEETGMTPEEIAAVDMALISPESLQQETAEGLTLESTLRAEEPDVTLVERIALRDAIDALPEKERKTILLRFFQRANAGADSPDITGITGAGIPPGAPQSAKAAGAAGGMSKGRDRGTRRTAAQNHAQGEAQRGDLCRTARRTVRCGGCSFLYSRRDAHPLPFGGVRERRMFCLPLPFHIPEEGTPS